MLTTGATVVHYRPGEPFTVKEMPTAARITDAHVNRGPNGPELLLAWYVKTENGAAPAYSDRTFMPVEAYHEVFGSAQHVATVWPENGLPALVLELWVKGS